ncbi:ep1-like glycoprotein 2 [Quercus suber]|uniref:Ep1-like glycoprotein 2 n=1 Tax=Quercus suber TaxID=58331 RepID=A0AAW0KBG6_QUESU
MAPPLSLSLSLLAPSTLSFFLTPFPILVTAQLEPANNYLPVNSPISWTNDEYGDFENSPTLWTNRYPAGNYNNTSYAGIILASRYFSDTDYGSACGCGFFCNQTCNSSLFALFPFKLGLTSFGAEVPWSANPNNPVRKNATLKLTSKRGLVLQDADGTIAWSTNIGNKSVAGLLLTDTCNLMLLDENNATIWQSFDHQQTRWFLGKSWCQDSSSLAKEDCFRSLSPEKKGWLLISILTLHYPTTLLIIYQYVRLESDGHLRVYNEDWSQGYENDVLTRYIEGENCGYPTYCGNYSFCSNRDQCICPPPINGKSYFRYIDDRQPRLGCSLVTPVL